eukprot:snap_masked-scaffold_36-processed-gene-0.23-mRNA-1 protein AED:0.06 eAED:0.11 QI:0/-1/0/1/-1/1/1/0/188
MKVEVILIFLFLHSITSKTLNCGRAKVCGILVLESGYGKNVYHHRTPMVHGLWPQVPPYGTSVCLHPAQTFLPDQVYPCYKDVDENNDHQLKFETHEWLKHGTCSGVKNSSDYFHQVCSLAKDPLKRMKEIEQQSSSFLTLAKEISKSGFPLFDIDNAEKQLYLSACLNRKKGKWFLAKIDDFVLLCD